MNSPGGWAFGWTQLLTIIGFIITVGIAGIGFRTFGRWKREKLEEKRIDIAFDMLALAYEAQFIFAHIRGPMAYAHEWADMPEIVSETADQRSARGTFYATLSRIAANKDYFERLWKLQPRCMAMFGAEVADVFMLVHRARREVEVAAQMLASPGRKFGDDMRSKLEHAVWDTGNFEPEKDEVGKKLSEFRTRTEALCKPSINAEFKRNQQP
jgi:hypothetical protein